MTAVPTSQDLYVATPAGKIFARAWGDMGEGVPIILFHDSLGCVELWRDFPGQLAAAMGRAVVAYDRIGFGKSDAASHAPAEDFLYDEARINVPALRQALGITRMILFGHSVGGAMAVITGAAFPTETVAVITESAQAFVEERTVAGIRAAAALFEAPEQFEKLARYHGDKARTVLNNWTGLWLSPRFRSWTIDDELKKLSCPVLALHGDRDDYGSRAHPDRIATLPPQGGKAVIFENCGHIPHREMPEAVLREVAAFLLKD